MRWRARNLKERFFKNGHSVLQMSTHRGVELTSITAYPTSGIICNYLQKIGRSLVLLHLCSTKITTTGCLSEVTSPSATYLHCRKAKQNCRHHLSRRTVYFFLKKFSLKILSFFLYDLV